MLKSLFCLIQSRDLYLLILFLKVRTFPQDCYLTSGESFFVYLQCSKGTVSVPVRNMNVFDMTDVFF